MSILVALCANAGAQDGFSKHTTRLLDSGLSVLDMNRKDLAMRADAVNFDHQRLSLINKLFSTPWKSGEVAAYYSAQFKNFSIGNLDLVGARVMSDMQFGIYKPLELNADTTLLNLIQSVQTPSGKTLPREVLDNFVLSSIIQQYVVPTLKAAQLIDAARQNCLRHSVVVAQCDSLLMMSEDDAAANPYELKAAELRSDSIAQVYFDEATTCDVQQLSNCGLSLFRQLLTQAGISASAQQLLRDSVQSIILNTKYGPIAIGGAGNDRYEGQYLMILDIGGDDQYSIQSSKASALRYPLSVLVDLSGSDIYLGSSYSIASGVFGSGFVIDMSGNDTYKAGSFSMGAGLFGVGILYDESGTDSYQGGVFSQGAGAFGIGALIDQSGNDSYCVQAYGQGFGYSGGFGVLSDTKGNDVYTTQSPFVDILRYDSHFVSFTQGAALGQRPTASGGIGMLLDAQGNDSYSCDIYGQGSAYWFGFAALVDSDGEDRYAAYQYAQGAGIHFAHGLLWDRGGDDVYVSHGVSQGCGHDVGVGILVDEGGGDSYVAESLSLGAGNANAVSIFIDEQGDDSYIARNIANCMGYSDFRRSYGMIGVFIDAKGNDLYGETQRNNTVSTKSSYGAFIDFGFEPFATPGALSNSSSNSISTSLSKAEGSNTPKLILSSTLDSLFVQASTAPQKYQYMVNPARDRLVAGGDSALMYCAGHFASLSPRERLALEYIIPKMYEKDSVAMMKLLGDSLTSTGISTLNFCMWAVGKIKIPSLSDALQSLTQHSDWRIRAAAAQQIGEAGMNDALDACEQLLKDSIAPVRMRAIYSIGQLDPERLLRVAKVCLKDPFQTVRNSVGCGLKAHKNVSPDLLAQLLDNYTTSHARHSLVLALPGIDTTSSSINLQKAVLAMEDDEREWCYRLLQEQKGSFWDGLRIQLASHEQNVSLRTYLQTGSGAAGIVKAPVNSTEAAKATKPKKNKSK